MLEHYFERDFQEGSLALAIREKRQRELQLLYVLECFLTFPLMPFVKALEISPLRAISQR